MSRITKQTQKQLKSLFLNIKLRQNILEFITVNPKNVESIKLDLEKKPLKLIRYLESRRLLNKTQEGYRLTNLGKFAYLMSKYDINFLELCFLLETYCCEKRMQESCKYGFYVKYSFYEKIEDMISYGTLSNAITSLCKKKLIYRHHKASYCITHEVFMQLSKYDDIIDVFHDWFIEMWKKKNELILKDPFVTNRQKDYLNLCKKTIFR